MMELAGKCFWQKVRAHISFFSSEEISYIRMSYSLSPYIPVMQSELCVCMRGGGVCPDRASMQTTGKTVYVNSKS